VPWLRQVNYPSLTSEALFLFQASNYDVYCGQNDTERILFLWELLFSLVAIISLVYRTYCQLNTTIFRKQVGETRGFPGTHERVPFGFSFKF